MSLHEFKCCGRKDVSILVMILHDLLSRACIKSSVSQAAALLNLTPPCCSWTVWLSWSEVIPGVSRQQDTCV